jgi:adenosylhomocysteine nucleosidase
MTIQNETLNVVILISADSEWLIIKELFPRKKLTATPYGEKFEAAIKVEDSQQPVIFVHGGWGKISAAASTQYAIDRLHPSMIINLGTCGGFEGCVEREDIIFVNKTIVYDIIEQMGDPQEAVNAYTTTLDLKWLGEMTPGIRRGMIISADRDIVQKDVESLKRQYGAVAADWESGAIAWVANRNNTPLLILRGVSDIVSATDAQAYGDVEHFEQGTRSVMTKLIILLPQYLKQWNNWESTS